ncbi:hypothetical protein Taro_031266 [Colocasia esculenta]|uniref:Uncharacterized protein n=1 Tax=Colocasia esculenta TaxID=4460 RepID=A0A843W0D2_COLES|nr:hypothetical protein [Colocasia esculenta]
MVHGGRSLRLSTSVGRGSASPSTLVVPAIGTASPSMSVVPTTETASPSTPVVPATGTASPTTPVASPFPSQSPPAADEEGPQLPGRQPCWILGGKIDPGSASRYIMTLVHAHIPGPVDSWKEFPPSVRELLFDMFTERSQAAKRNRAAHPEKNVHTRTASPTTPVASPFPSQSPPAADEEGPQLPRRQPCWILGYAFTRPEDLPQARVVWESTVQTNFKKSMWEARDKAMKTTGSRDPTTWLDYNPVWLRRDYWESLCHRWATEPWQERSQAAKRNRAAHPEKNHHELERAPTFRELFDRTHKWKGTDDYVSESARMIAETYDRMMADRYAEGTPQPDLDLEAWVDIAGGPRKGRVYGFGDSLDTTPELSSYVSSVAPPAYTSSSAAPPDSGGEDMRTLIQKELQTQFDVMVEQLISTIRGVRPSQQAPQVSITINFI